MTVPYIVTDSTLTIFLEGTPFSFEEEHPIYSRVVAALQSGDVEELTRLATSPQETLDKLAAEFTEDCRVLYGGKELHNVIVDRIVSIHALGLPTDPMLRFLENLMQNPSETSREELYEFLAHSYLPITEDGHFLGYKAVRENYLDIHSGTYDNSVGSVIEMPRSNVDPNRHNHCSAGFHVGTMNYVRDFGGSSSRFLLVKVNPKDAVSVPADHNAEKLRCCRYEVVKEIARDEVLKLPVYDESGSASLAPDVQMEDWEYESEDEDYDPWADAEESEEVLDVEEGDLEEYRSSRSAFYDSNYDRDEVVDMCVDRGLVSGVNAGRALRKAGCISLLVGADAKNFFAV